MEPNSADNFECILQLTRFLSSECRSSREQTDNLATLLNRLADQSGIIFEETSGNTPDEELQKYNEIVQKSEEELLIEENYKLLYQIEQQEYINSKIRSLINNIAEHINSIKLFLIEERIIKDNKKVDFIMDPNELDTIRQSTETLKTSKDILQTKINSALHNLRLILKETNFQNIDKTTFEFRQFQKSIKILNDIYNAKLDVFDL
ncbi:hypothetical protein TPHA_0L01850 [Tetrapisispora phaffii CBS 4417]|uniref:Uncharacterized protein n=1 Tax=Tetrapisispora phaffii (strain ATCC 24235 / CBS 4417 / NBRC 1672 / NRRL Y-8282 / UCD 70-5) TaxID=1071381 RepID=G8C060_TETPH|nr:hypothetical protein TPHA_0L01850 [Tetrapisispora phaffii CBS 4417]CCE65538.1 hypothetical protein TPHA_0L01850 [Tetrapisispora phaffii CBS 4417]